MVDNPYQVLGVPETASMDEIKKAYRKKARENHPDLHPDDPGAERRMVDINEAYDRLAHPQKYADRRPQQSSTPPPGGQNTQHQYYRRTEYGDYRGYGFGSFFGFNAQEIPSALRAGILASDSDEIVIAVNLLNGSRFQDALQMLIKIPSTGRHARWYYLSALANYGLHNTVQTIDHMQKAVQLDPNNREYRELLQYFRRSEQSYAQRAEGFNMNAGQMHKFCIGLFMMQLLCSPFRYFYC